MSGKDRLPLIIFAGGVSGSEPERWVGLACRANTLDLVAKAAEVPRLGPIVVVTPAEGWSGELARLPVEVVADAPGAPFHFGQCLREVTARYGFSRLLYLGGGSGALLCTAALAALTERALGLERCPQQQPLFRRPGRPGTGVGARDYRPAGNGQRPGLAPGRYGPAGREPPRDSGVPLRPGHPDRPGDRGGPPGLRPGSAPPGAEPSPRHGAGAAAAG